MPTTSLDLFRSLRKEDFPQGTMADADTPTTGVLYPDFYEKQIGVDEFGEPRMRKPDVTMGIGEDDQEWVKTRAGTSLFDKANVFKGKSWLSFKIPEGTEIPASLKIRNTGWNDRFKATHYQIECREAWMRKDAFQGALDNLARNAVVRAKALA